jgi:hypothetical protein
MPKYKVYSSQLVYHETTVEAEDKEQAMEIAWEDNCDWKQYHLGDWEIEEVKEIQE